VPLVKSDAQGSHTDLADYPASNRWTRITPCAAL
jgi:hypothetical protein